MAKGELRPLGLVKSGRGKLLFIPGMGAGEYSGEWEPPLVRSPDG